MLLKNTIADIPFTGAKQVIYCNNTSLTKTKRNAILLFSADCVNSLQGGFITGTDMGLSADDVSLMAQYSPYILANESGYTCYDTAVGIVQSLLVMSKQIFPNKQIADLRLLVQGAGQVGAYVVKMLRGENIPIFIYELDKNKAIKICNQYGAISVADVSSFKGDIFIPCAREHSVYYDLVKKMGVMIIAGAANNQLLTENDDVRFAAEGIFYAPDYVINSGGAIHAAAGYLGWSDSQRLEKISMIPQKLQEIYKMSLLNKIGTSAAAKQYIWKRIKLTTHDKE